MNKKAHNCFYKKDGFTYVELLIVVGIMIIFGVFFVMAVDPVGKIKAQRDSQRESDINSILLSVEQKIRNDRGWNCSAGPLPQDKFTAIGTGPGEYDLYSCLTPNYLSKYLVDPKEGSIAGRNITDGLVGHWKFDEGEGTTAYDASGNDNHGTLVNGPSWVDGKIGGALEFDGLNEPDPQSVNVGKIETGTSFTFSYWVYHKEGIRIYGGNITRNSSAGIMESINGMLGYHYIYRDTLCNEFYYGPDRNLVYSNYTLPGGFNWPRWAHISVSVEYDSINDNSIVKFYVDGEPGTTHIVTEGEFNSRDTSTNHSTRLGSLTTYRLDGSLDDFRIYNRVLSDAEIQDLYNYEYSSKYAIWQNPVTKNVSLKSLENETKEVSTGAPEVALDLNKDPDNVYTPIPEGVVSTDSQYTISIRFKLKEIPSSGNTSGLWVGSDRRTGIDYNWNLGIEGEGLLRMGTRSPNARSCSKLVYHSDALSEWHMATLTYNSKHINCYHNGSFFQEMTSNDIEDLDDSFLRIGSGILGGTGSPTIASFSDARIYNRALSEEEVEQLYKGYDIRNGLVGHWPLNEGQGTTAYDRSGNGNNGTLLPAIDGPTWTTK